MDVPEDDPGSPELLRIAKVRGDVLGGGPESGECQEKKCQKTQCAQRSSFQPSSSAASQARNGLRERPRSTEAWERLPTMSIVLTSIQYDSASADA